jgi:histidine triad (HIT) family protein
MTDTIFGKIARGEIPADLIYEDADCVAFRDISPQAPVHILIIPRKSIPTLDHAQPEDAELIGKLFLAAAAVARQVGIADSGYRTVVNCKAAGGQTVFHLHLHLLGGRSLGWPPG